MKTFSKFLEEKNSGVDSIQMTVPMFIRVLEWAREEAKSDVEVHEFVERVIAKNKLLSTEDYNSVIK